MTIRIINADVMDGLAQLESESVHCVVTSPPYFGLRDYGTAQWEGGDPECDHVYDRTKGMAASTLGGGKGSQPKASVYRECPKCAATRTDKQIGLEPTPDAYVAKMVEVFREIRRVLRKDGTCWLNLGDSYWGSWANYSGGERGAGKQRIIKHGSIAKNPVWDGLEEYRPSASYKHESLKPKDLIGIPWRVAFALHADGWWLRQDIIWSKPNPMPESVTDRCTKAHEYIFLLSKAEHYYYDADAIKQPAAPASFARLNQDIENQNGSDRVPGKTNGPMKAVFGGRNKHDGYGTRIHSGNEDSGAYLEAGVNRRSVWEVATQPFSEAHFATFPPALIEPCIKAGCPEGGTVLDPFGGSGTTGLVADRLKRNAILIELNPEYAAMAERRIKGDCPMFAEIGRV